MKMQQDADGTYSIIGRHGAVIASGLTNAQAWRQLDKLRGEPDSRSQATADWSFKKGASGE